MGLFDRLTGQLTGFIDDVLLPDEQRTMVLRAEKALRDHDHTEALRLLDDLESQRPGLTRVQELRGQAFMGLNQHERAIEAFSAVATARPDPHIFLKLGLALLATGQPRPARGALRQGLQHNPITSVRFDLHKALGGVHQAMNRPDRAAVELRKALRLLEGSQDPELLARAHDARVDLAWALLARHERDEARQLLDQTIEDDISADPRALRALGRLLLQEGHPAQALPHLNTMLVLEPDAHDARLDAARAALQAQDLDTARGHLLEGIERAPTPLQADLHTMLAMVAMHTDDHQSALGHLQEALKHDPDHVEALETAGWASLAAAADNTSLRDTLLTQAEAHFQRLRIKHPQSLAALHGLGQARLDRGDWTGARRLLSEACAQPNAPMVAHLSLAKACLESGDPAAAIATLGPHLEGPEQQEAEYLLHTAYAQLSPALPRPPAKGKSLAPLQSAAMALLEQIAAAPTFLPFLPRAQRLLHALDTPLDIAVLGEFNAGKSTLVNALMGEALVPTGVLPTTAHINVLKYGPRRAAQLHFTDQSVEEIPLGQLRRRVKDDDAQRSIDHIEVLYPHPDLRRVHFWDTPGFNALDPDHERHATDALERAEAIIWLVDAGQALADSEMQLLEQVHDGDERMIVVINKIDRLGFGPDRAEGIQVLTDRVADILGDGVSATFAISALEGLKARQAQDPDALQASGVAALLDHLQADVYERVAALKAIDGTRAWHQLTHDMIQHAQSRLALLSDLQTRLDTIKEGIAAQAHNFTTHFIAEERRRLVQAIDTTLVTVAREITDALQPAPGLVGALLTRVSLSEEDLEFVVSLLEERLAQVLQASQQRVTQNLLEAETRLIEGIETMDTALEAPLGGVVRRRLTGHLSETRALRALLTDRVYGRYRAIAKGRTSAPGVMRVIERSARKDTTMDEHKATLRRLLPDVEDAMTAALAGWAREYFDAAARFCDITHGDLKVSSIELQALITGLQAPTQEH